MTKSEIINDILQDILASYNELGVINHIHGPNLPSRKSVIEIVRLIEEILFPGFFENIELDETDLSLYTANRLSLLFYKLSKEIRKNISFNNSIKTNHSDQQTTFDPATEKTRLILSRVPGIRVMLKKDLESIFAGDPAAKFPEEIILAYPGLRAISIYRLAHELWKIDIKMIARMMSEYVHSRTGVDIHPGARIGENFFIDHGTGIVIGETTQIGNNVKIYQGVTLGALSVDKKLENAKRHPTIEDHVTIYANATILGGRTVIGKNSVIGGNVWLTESVPPESVVLNSPTLSVKSKNNHHFTDYII